MTQRLPLKAAFVATCARCAVELSWVARNSICAERLFWAHGWRLPRNEDPEDPTDVLCPDCAKGALGDG
jgi:hypothetical protein